ncbi:hypothetical protein BCR34DRAFT_633792 [Clohesyomyces aquaticus]|uniref:Uncharacterized protein n=1 Tax=Clohesyomyces aquaticus TaxID=1231657 RepID=A0A1Y1Z3B8_9PLEO|nr:hypothetical protein BCR34DRAFT_633792 [Clohesyomyces aquaticus]
MPTFLVLPEGARFWPVMIRNADESFTLRLLGYRVPESSRVLLTFPPGCQVDTRAQSYPDYSFQCNVHVIPPPQGFHPSYTTPGFLTNDLLVFEPGAISDVPIHDLIPFEPFSQNWVDTSPGGIVSWQGPSPDISVNTSNFDAMHGGSSGQQYQGPGAFGNAGGFGFVDEAQGSQQHLGGWGDFDTIGTFESILGAQQYGGFDLPMTPSSVLNSNDTHGPGNSGKHTHVRSDGGYEQQDKCPADGHIRPGSNSLVVSRSASVSSTVPGRDLCASPKTEPHSGAHLDFDLSKFGGNPDPESTWLPMTPLSPPHGWVSGKEARASSTVDPKKVTSWEPHSSMNLTPISTHSHEIVPPNRVPGPGKESEGIDEDKNFAARKNNTHSEGAAVQVTQRKRGRPRLSSSPSLTQEQLDLLLQHVDSGISYRRMSQDYFPGWSAAVLRYHGMRGGGPSHPSRTGTIEEYDLLINLRKSGLSFATIAKDHLTRWQAPALRRWYQRDPYQRIPKLTKQDESLLMELREKEKMNFGEIAGRYLSTWSPVTLRHKYNMLRPGRAASNPRYTGKTSRYMKDVTSPRPSNDVPNSESASAEPESQPQNGQPLNSTPNERGTVTNSDGSMPSIGLNRDEEPKSDLNFSPNLPDNSIGEPKGRQNLGTTTPSEQRSSNLRSRGDSAEESAEM